MWACNYERTFSNVPTFSKKIYKHKAVSLSCSFQIVKVLLPAAIQKLIWFKLLLVMVGTPRGSPHDFQRARERDCSHGPLGCRTSSCSCSGLHQSPRNELTLRRITWVNVLSYFTPLRERERFSSLERGTARSTIDVRRTSSAPTRPPRFSPWQRVSSNRAFLCVITHAACNNIYIRPTVIKPLYCRQSGGVLSGPQLNYA